MFAIRTLRCALAAVLLALGLPAASDEPAPAPPTSDEALVLLMDPVRRADGVSALAAHGPAGYDALARWWKGRKRDAASAEAAAEAAAAFGSSAGPLVSDLVSSELAQLQVARAAVALGPSGRATRLEAARRFSDDQARAVLFAALADEGASDAVPLLREAVERGGPGARAAAAVPLARLTGAREAPLVIRILSELTETAGPADLPAREALIAALGEMGGEAVVAPLVDALRRPDQRAAAVAALARVGRPAAGHLALVVKSGDPSRLPGAVAALLGLGKEGAAAFAGALGSPDERVRAIARDVLLSFGGASVDTLAQMIRAGTAAQAADALRIAVHLPEQDAARALRLGLDRQVPDVRLAALELIGRTGHGALLEDVVRLAERDASAAVRRGGVVALHRLAAFGTADLLERLAQRDEREVRVAALAALADLGSADHVPGVAQALQSNDAEVVKAARRTLARLTGEPRDRSAPEWLGWYEAHRRRVERLVGSAARPREEAALTEGGAVGYRVSGRGAVLLAVTAGPAADPGALAGLLEPLAARRRVVTVELRGRDDAAGPASGGEPWRPDRDIADLEAVRRALGAESVSLLGHSSGAAVAVRYAEVYPARVESLVLVSPPGTASGWPVSDERTAALPEPWRSDWQRTRLEGFQYAPDALRHYEQRLALAAALTDLSLLALLRDELYPRRAPAAFDVWADYDVAGALASVQRPTLVVVGEASAPAQRMSPLSRLPHVTLATIRKVGHFPLLEAPEDAFEAIGKFLDR